MGSQSDSSSQSQPIAGPSASVGEAVRTGAWTPEPWLIFTDRGASIAVMPAGRAGDICSFEGSIGGAEREANAALIQAAPLMAKALALQEIAEEFNANCPDCGGEGVPEVCGTCFPLFDDARLARWCALLAAHGEELPRAEAAPLGES